MQLLTRIVNTPPTNNYTKCKTNCKTKHYQIIKETKLQTADFLTGVLPINIHLMFKGLELCSSIAFIEQSRSICCMSKEDIFFHQAIMRCEGFNIYLIEIMLNMYDAVIEANSERFLCWIVYI